MKTFFLIYTSMKEINVYFYFFRWNTKKKLKFFIKLEIVLGKKKHKEVNVFTPYT